MELLCIAFQVYYFVLLARIIFSLVAAFGGRIPDGLMPVYKAVNDLTEPVLAPFRRIIPPVGMFDVSFLVAILLLSTIRRIICG